MYDHRISKNMHDTDNNFTKHTSDLLRHFVAKWMEIKHFLATIHELSVVFVINELDIKNSKIFEKLRVTFVFFSISKSVGSSLILVYR